MNTLSKRITAMLIAFGILVAMIFFLLSPIQVPAAAIIVPTIEITATQTIVPTSTVPPTLTSTATPEPTLTATPTITYWTPEPKVYPSPTGMTCEIEQQWGRGEGHDYEYGCFALSCGFKDGTAYGNNLVCLVDKTHGTPWPYEWDFYHPLIAELHK